MLTKTMTAGTSVYRTFWKDKKGKWTGTTTRTVVYTDPLPWASTTWLTLEHTMWVSNPGPTLNLFKSLPTPTSTTIAAENSVIPTLITQEPRTNELLKISTTSRYKQAFFHKTIAR